MPGATAPGRTLPRDANARGVLLAFAWHTWVPITVSVLALLIALRAEKRAGRAEQRAEAADMRDEIRFERERQQTETENRARIQLWATGSQAEIDHRRCAFRIANVGKVTAHGVRVWLRDADGNDASTTPQPTFDLAPDQADTTRGIPVALDLELGELWFTVAWADGAGAHTWPSHMSPIERRHGSWPEDVSPAS
jgi:hypothetical protein